ncbi:ATPase [bacterium]|nr:MAG: ATPase [bacterium]
MINTVPLTPGKLLPCLETLHALKMPAYLHGAPGIGKSSIIRDYAVQKGLELKVVILSQIEAADLRGLPALEPVTKRTTWYPPEFLPSGGAGILFLDELSAAEPRLQVAAYQLILDRRIGDYVLPPDWWVVGAGNAPDDGAIAFDMGSALADRLVHFKVVPESREWIKWGQSHAISPEVLAFIQVKPDFLEANQLQQSNGQLIGPTPRSWERVSRVLEQEKNRVTREYIVSGIVGEAAAAEFFHVVEEIAELPPISELLAASGEELDAMLPRTLPALYGLTYSLTAYVSDFETARDAMRVLVRLGEIEDAEGEELPRSEVQALAMELLLAKIGQLGLMLDIADTEEYATYREKVSQIVELS